MSQFSTDIVKRILAEAEADPGLDERQVRILEEDDRVRVSLEVKTNIATARLMLTLSADHSVEENMMYFVSKIQNVRHEAMRVEAKRRKKTATRI